MDDLTMYTERDRIDSEERRRQSTLRENIHNSGTVDCVEGQDLFKNALIFCQRSALTNGPHTGIA